MFEKNSLFDQSKELPSLTVEARNYGTPEQNNDVYRQAISGSSASKNEVNMLFGAMEIYGADLPDKSEKVAFLWGKNPTDAVKSYLDEVRELSRSGTSPGRVSSEAERLVNGNGLNLEIWHISEEQRQVRSIAKEFFNQEFSQNKISYGTPKGPVTGYMGANIEKGEFKVRVYSEPYGKGKIVEPENSSLYK